MTELLTVSASKLKVYAMCPRRFWYEYIEKAERTKHPAAAMGTAIHKAVELGHQKIRDGQDAGLVSIMSVKDYSDTLDEVAAKDGIVVDTFYYRDGVKMMQAYDFTKRMPVESELEFRLPFPDPISPLCYIHGYIDQMYDWGIVDLKSSKRKPMQGLLDNDLQFITYWWAYHQITGEVPNHVLWHHLRTSEDLVAAVAHKTDDVARVVERIYDSQVTGIYDKCVGEACRICSFRAACLGTEK